MAPLIGKDMSEAIFLERFAALCVDPLFHVRKVCAANFGDFSSVVGMESTEKVLVSNQTLPWKIDTALHKAFRKNKNKIGIVSAPKFKVSLCIW